MIKCVFYLPDYRKWIPPHIAQVVFGFLKLARDGIVDVSFANNAREYARGYYLAEIDGLRVFYDVADANFLSPAETDQVLEDCDFIFKRSFDPSVADRMKNRDRYFPLGLFYQFFPPGFSFAPIWST